MKSLPVLFMVSEDMKKEIENEAWKRHLSVSEYLRQAHKYLAECPVIELEALPKPEVTNA